MSQVDSYSLLSAEVQSGMRDKIRQLAQRYGAELQVSEGSVVHVQLRLPTDQLDAFIEEAEAAACGSIRWTVV
jgi:hypothetical protein